MNPLSPLARFLEKHGVSIPGLLVKGAITGAAAVPAGYGVAKLIGDPEQEELKAIMKEVKSVKRKQLESMRNK